MISKVELNKAEKLTMVMILLDIVEMYALEVLPGTRFELKKAVKEAIVVNRKMTEISSKYLNVTQTEDDDVAIQFGEGSDFIKEMIEIYFKGKLVKEGDYYKFKLGL